MNLFLMPMMVSITAAGLLAVVAVVGTLLLISPRSAPAGKRILTYGFSTLGVCIAFAWIGFIVMLPLLNVTLFRSPTRNLPLGAVVFWASVPIGLLAGFWRAYLKEKSDIRNAAESACPEYEIPRTTQAADKLDDLAP